MIEMQDGEFNIEWNGDRVILRHMTSSRHMTYLNLQSFGCAINPLSFVTMTFIFLKLQRKKRTEYREIFIRKKFTGQFYVEQFSLARCKTKTKVLMLVNHII